MSQEGYSVYIADGFADDCEELIHSCSRVHTLNYTTFCNIYKDMKFDGLYEGRMMVAEIAELSEEILHVAKHYMVTDTSNFEESVAGLFLVYTLLNTQPFPMFAALRLIPDDMEAINRIQVVARRERRLDVLYILGHVLIKGPCQFHATARERGLEPGLRKYFGRTATIDRSGLRPKGVFQRQNDELDNIRVLCNLSRLYCDTKNKLVGGSTDRNLSYWDSGIANWLDTSLRKLVNGITDEVAGPSVAGRSDHVNAIKDRAMKLAVNSVAHLTGVNERAETSPKKRGSTSNQFILPRSPPKIIRKRKTTSSTLSSTTNEWEVPIVNNDRFQEKELTLTMSQHRLVLRKTRDLVLDESPQSSDFTELLPSDNIENKCNGNENLNMMMLDCSDDEIRHVDNNNKDSETQKAKTVVYVVKNKGRKGSVDKMANGKAEKKNMCQEKPSRKRKKPAKKSSENKMNNVCQEKPSKKRKMSSKASKNTKTKRRKGKVFVISDSSDSDSEIDLTLDDSDDDLYSITDDVENLTETIDDDIKRFENYKSPNNSEIESPKKPKNDTSERRRSKTRKSETDDVVNLTETIDDDINRLEMNKSPKNPENVTQTESERSKNNKPPKKTEIHKKTENRRSRTRKNEIDVPTNIENEDSIGKNRNNMDEIISQNFEMGAPKKTEIDKRESKRSRTRKSETDVLSNVDNQEKDVEINETPINPGNDTQSESTPKKAGSRRSRTRKSKTDVPTSVNNQENDREINKTAINVKEINKAPKNIKPKSDTQTESRRSRTRQNETQILSNVENHGKDNSGKVRKSIEELEKDRKIITDPEKGSKNTDDSEKGRKSIDEIISVNLENGVPMLIQTDNGDQFIEIHIVDSIDNSKQSNVETVDKIRCLRTRQVNTTISPVNKLNSPKSKPKSPVRKPSTEKSPTKKENRLAKQNVLAEKQMIHLNDASIPTIDKNLNSPKTRSNLKNTNIPLIDETQKSPKKTSNINTKQNSPKTLENLETIERCTRSRIKDNQIKLKSLPDDVTIRKIDKNKSKTMSPHRNSSKTMSARRKSSKTMSPCRSPSKTMSPRRSSSKTMSSHRSSSKSMSTHRSSSKSMSPRRSSRAQSMAQLTLVQSPRVDAKMIKKRKAPECNVKGKAKLKSKFKRMGILPIANFKEEVSD